MAGESQKDPMTGQADPSVFTTEQLLRVVGSERDRVNALLEVVHERFRGIDEATKVLHETVTRTPTDIQQAVGHLHELVDERFSSVATQFQERDTRQERESRDNKVAVDAAFAAQKEAAAKQDEGNQKAIDKSERATNETIQTLGELFRTTTDGLKERQANFENQLTELRSVRQGVDQNRSDTRLNANVLIAIGGLIVAATILALALTR